MTAKTATPSWLTAVALLGLSATLVVAQNRTPPPVFRGGADIAQLDVSVLDDKRRPVADLKESDFTVLEDGVSRPIRVFRAVSLPARATTIMPWAAEVASDVATNAVGQQDGRVVVILMDRSIPVEGPTVTARKAALAIVDALGPNDLAAVISTSGGMPQTLTADKGRLTRAITQRDWSTGISPEAEAIMGKLDPLTFGQCLCGLCVMQSVTRVAEAVSRAPQRKKLLFFIGTRLIAQVGPRPMSADVGCDHRVRDERQKMFDALEVAGLTVHSIDPSGLGNSAPWSRAGARGGITMAAPAQRQQQFTTDTMAGLEDQNSLRILPDLTGGTAVVNSNDPDQQVPRIFQESDAYYVIGFEPRLPAPPGTRRSIEVKVARRGVRVHTQREYLTSPPTTAEPTAVARSLDEALGGLLPSATTPLQATAAAFAGRESRVATVRVDLGITAFAGPAGLPDLDVAVVAVDQTGRPVTSVRQSVTVPPSAGTRPAAAAIDLNVPVSLELAAGDYEIRAAAADRASGRVGSVYAQLLIPRFEAVPLSLSHVSVLVGGDTIATRRRFRTSEDVRAEVEIYQGTLRTDAIQAVSVRVRIIDAKGAEVRAQGVTFEESRFVARRATARLALPVAQLPSGDYLLRLDATMAGESATRAVPFSVE